MKRTITLRATVRSRLKLKHAFTILSVEMESNAGIIISSPRMSFTFVGICRPPSSNGMFNEHLRNALKELDRNKELILVGDLNINWAKKLGKSLRT